MAKKKKIRNDEANILRKIEEELSEGRYDTYREIMYPGYKEIPVDIETFIKDRRYLGNTYINEDGSCSMYPFWLDWITHRTEKE